MSPLQQAELLKQFSLVPKIKGLVVQNEIFHKPIHLVVGEGGAYRCGFVAETIL